MVTTEEIVRLFLAEDDLADHLGTQRSVTVRMEQGRLAYIDSMAAQAGVSRNVMVNHLLGLAIDDVLASLAGVSPETIEAIESGVADRMGDS